MIREELTNLSTEELIGIINVKNADYTQEAVEIAKDEILKRGFSHLVIPFADEGLKLENIENPILSDLVLRTSYADIKEIIETEFTISFNEIESLEELYSKLLFEEKIERSNISISLVRYIHMNNPLRKDIQILGVEDGDEEKFQLGLYHSYEWLGFKINLEEVISIGIEHYLVYCMLEILQGQDHESEDIVSGDLEEHLELPEVGEGESEPDYGDEDEDTGFSFKKLFGLM